MMMVSSTIECDVTCFADTTTRTKPLLLRRANIPIAFNCTPGSTLMFVIPRHVKVYPHHKEHSQQPIIPCSITANRIQLYHVLPKVGSD